MDYDRTSLEWFARDFANFTCEFPDEKATIVTKLVIGEASVFDLVLLNAGIK